MNHERPEVSATFQMDGATAARIFNALDTRAFEARYIALAPRLMPRLPTPGADDPRDMPVILLLSLLESAIDHLRTWRLVLETRRQPLYAHATLCRGSLDASLLVIWMLADPSLVVPRAVAIKRADHRERGNFERDFDIGPEAYGPTGKTASEREAILVALAEEQGISSVVVPAWVDLYRAHAIATPAKPGAGAALYRLLSAYTHASYWRNLTVQVVGERPREPGGLGVTTSSDSLSEQFALITRQGVERALESAEEFARSWETGS